MSAPYAPSPEPPYYAVIFANRRRTPEIDVGYAETAARMVALAEGRPGFIGIESARGADGFGITVSYWRDEASIAAWKADAEHSLARESGRSRWYAGFTLRVAKVERAYAWGEAAAAAGSEE